jgi:transcriptional regulator GlxA family with amidase domain
VNIPHDVLFVVFDGVKMLDVTGPAEVFAEANRFGANYRMAYVSPTGHDVATSIGARLPAGTAAELGPPDSGPPDSGSPDSRRGIARTTLLVPGGDRLPHEPAGTGLTELVLLLNSRAHRIASICTGAFVLAAAGLLDGRRATTHWLHADRLARAYPRISVHHDALYVKDGTIYTSAGVSSGIDLALALVESDHGAELAREVARSLVVYMQRPGGQSQFSAPLSWPSPALPGLRAVVDAVCTDPAADHSARSLAALAAVSPRHLARLFKAELDTTPTRFIEQVRLDAAKSLLDAGHTVTDTSRLSGFGSDESLRRAFTNKFGLSPSYYRGRFRLSERTRDEVP